MTHDLTPLARETERAIRILVEAEPINVNGYTIRALPNGGGAFYETDDPAELPALCYPHYCSLCNAINGGERDGEGPCEHKEAVVIAWCEVMARDEAERMAPRESTHQPRRWDNQPTRAEVEAWQG